MSRSTTSRLRWVWFQLHLWVGVALSLLLIPVSLSGSYLVWREEFDKLLYPSRSQVTDPEVKLPASAYLTAAQTAFGDRATAATLRLPQAAGEPVVVTGPLGPPDRGQARGEGRPRGEGAVARRDGEGGGAREAGPPRPRGALSAWIDPGTARVLDVGNPRAGVMIFMHDLHGHIFVSGGVGRKVVGWLGWAMLGSCLTGLWLWWPRNGKLKHAFRWTRSPDTLLNLHYMVGFWVAIPLAVLSLTGALISFPQTTRALVGALQPLTPQPPRGQAGPPRGPQAPIADPMLTPDQAVQAALGVQPGKLVSLNLPTRAGSWRAEVEPAGGGARAQLTVEDQTGAARRLPPPRVQPAGDRTIRFNRRLHDGIGFPMTWRIVITVAGVIPALLGVTGVIVWARRELRKAAMRRRIAEPVAAE